MATNSDPATTTQITWHQRAAEALHSHATWAAIATVVVLALKYLFSINVTEPEVLTFAGIMATYLFGASWVAAAHINAMADLGVKKAEAASGSAMMGIVANVGDGIAKAIAPQPLRPLTPPPDTSSPAPQG